MARGVDRAGEKAFLQLPGANTAALDWCRAHGLRLMDHALFFASGEFGQMDRYVLASPSLL